MARQSNFPLLASLLVTLAPLADLARAQVPATNDATGEDAFLDTVPPLDLPEVLEPIPGVVNEEFRTCENIWPAEYKKSQLGNEARAYRDIYGFVKARNVIETRDCTCRGKVADWSQVEAIASGLKRQVGSDRLRWQDTAALFKESNDLFAVVETLCGGDF